MNLLRQPSEMISRNGHTTFRYSICESLLNKVFNTPFNVEQTPNCNVAPDTEAETSMDKKETTQNKGQGHTAI